MSRSPDRMAVVDGDHALNYGELLDAISRVAASLQELGVGAGDVVTYQLPNWWETCVVHHAINWIGAVANPVVPIYRERELGFILRQAGSRVFVVPEEFRSREYLPMVATLLEELPPGDRPEVVVVRGGPNRSALGHPFEDLLGGQPGRPAVGDPDDIALLLYTSGTTADPKGVLHNHETLVYEAMSIAKLFGLGSDDPIFMPSPLTHITGMLYGILLPGLIESHVVLLDVWDAARAVDLIESYGCHTTVAATPFLQELVAEYSVRGQTSSLHTFGCGGAGVPPELIRQARSVLTATVGRMYGLSEFPTSCGSGPDDPVEIAADTDGLPIGSVEHKLAALDDQGVGELLIRGPEMFLGYLDPSLNEDCFDADGFFKTGDLASIDSTTGSITIRGRKKDVILRGGENISAKEIEDLLFAHPKVQGVAVVSMPHPRLGETVCAYIVPTDQDAPPDLPEIVVYLGTKGLAKQKYPEAVRIVTEIPMTSSGKVQKFILREWEQSRATDLKR